MREIRLNVRFDEQTAAQPNVSSQKVFFRRKSQASGAVFWRFKLNLLKFWVASKIVKSKHGRAAACFRNLSKPFMNRLVNIFMIIIIVSCPLRCMMQGCGCFSEMPTCCSLMIGCAPEYDSPDAGVSDCCCKKSESKKAPTPVPVPRKCKSTCFCSGVILADDFVLNEDQSSEPLFLEVETATVIASFRLLLESNVGFYPPDNLRLEHSANRGRQIRCLINSFVI